MKLRTVIALVVFLLGTMYLWSSPAFVKVRDLRSGAPAFASRLYTAGESLNQVYQLLAALTVLGFALAAWGILKGGDWWIFKGAEWWAPFAIGAAVLGLVVLIPWWFAVGTAAPGTTIAVNALLLIWDVAVLVVLLFLGVEQQFTKAL